METHAQSIFLVREFKSIIRLKKYWFDQKSVIDVKKK